MASSGNFCNFSIPLRPRSPYSSSDQITGGGLSIKLPSSGGIEPVIASMSPNSGKWYWEYRAGQGGTNTSGRPSIAVSEQGVKKDSEYYGGKSGITGVLFVTNDGGKRINGSDTSYGNTVSQHDIVQIALDCDNGAVYFGINNTWQNSGNPESGASKTGAALSSGIQNVAIDILHVRYVGGTIDQYNFGQDDTFGGAITAAGNADGNGHGVFKYAPPTGFLALCSANLSISEDIDPAETDDDYPAKQFNCTTYTGNSTDDRAVSLDMAPDLVVVKERGATNNWYWFDSTRGGGVALNSNLNSGTHTDSGELKTFTSTGFTLGTSGGTNNNTDTYAAWGWKANGGTTSSNSEGNITSTVQANTKAGFSIITYTGSGGTVSGANPTFGHGLESAPDFLIFKCTSNSSTNWICWHSGLGGANKYLSLNATTAEGTDTAWLSNTAPSSTLITTDNGGWGAVNGSGRTNICYAWHNVEGMQKFGYYEGNGNADGPFIYTGFRPRLFVQKRVDSTGSWRVWDAVRHPYNPNDAILRWEDSGAEDTANGVVDFLSNGVKIRMTYAEMNASGGDFVYMCWGDVPFKYGNTF